MHPIFKSFLIVFLTMPMKIVHWTISKGTEDIYRQDQTCWKEVAYLILTERSIFSLKSEKKLEDTDEIISTRMDDKFIENH